MHMIANRIIKFLIVGSIAAAIHYFVLIVLVELLTVEPVTASAIGFVASSFANYLLNYKYTFQSSLPHLIAYPRYITTAIVGLVINTSTMYLFVEIVQIHYMASQIIAIAVTLVWHFTINSVWSFKNKRTDG